MSTRSALRTRSASRDRISRGWPRSANRPPRARRAARWSGPGSRSRRSRRMSSRDRARGWPDPPRVTVPSMSANFSMVKEKGLAEGAGSGGAMGSASGAAAGEGAVVSSLGIRASRRGRTMRSSWMRRSPVNSVDQARLMKTSEAVRVRSGPVPGAAGVTRTSRSEAARRVSRRVESPAEIDRPSSVRSALSAAARRRRLTQAVSASRTTRRKRASGAPRMISHFRRRRLAIALPI